ncbi:sigma-54-dependent transcriptional regulator [Elioraea thermophila]|uniref:sigma-54-dependent transcriptional regulator n=1 Tax=Elioraea thermophila TaxID=2185104 RepID=UPI000DF3C85B|nr:sigma-54 dependent transcriptional regulator [Elioraea thermophila]
MPADQATVLLIEDTRSLAELYRAYLRDAPWRFVHVGTAAEARAFLAREPVEAVLLDLQLPDAQGLDVLRELRARRPAPEVIVITAHGSVATAVAAMQAGASDFLVKPFPRERLVVTIANALERRRLARELAELRRAADRTTFAGFIGAAPAMQAVYRIIENAAASRATVFITGESGTGKELAAEAIHRLSPRRDKPFVAINCAAIPRDLMESEMFGHVRGAFTGAVADRAGAASQADGGTLFLDEVCELDLALQGKLLRFIQTGTFQRVGSTKTEQVDVRFVCATNKDPLEEVRAGRFREDLYYRLHVIPITMPPLRERAEDILLIAEAFLARFAAEEKKAFRGFSAEAKAALLSYPWPGNVRELENAIRTAVVLHDGDLLEASMLPAQVIRPGRTRTTALPPRAPAGEDLATLIRPLAEVEREAIERAIALCGGNIAKAAAHLGVSPSTIYRKRAAWTGEAPSLPDVAE